MEYTKLGFVSGQKLKADHLNHMEDGIAALAQSAGGVSSWNDLTDKPFGVTIAEGLISWDGNIDNGYDVYMNNLYVKKIADKFLTEDDLLGATITYIANVDLDYGNPTEDETTFSYTITNDNMMKQELENDGSIIGVFVGGNTPAIWTINGDASSELGVPLSTGTYFIKCVLESDSLYAYPKSLSCLTGLVETVYRLDPKYLPEGYPYVKIVKGDATFNGDLTGREIVDLGDDLIFVKISPHTMTVEKLTGQTLTFVIGEEVQSVIIEEDGIEFNALDENNWFLSVLESVFVVKGDLSSAGVPLTEGTWFTYMPPNEEYGDPAMYVSSVTGLTADVETVHQIDKRFIPEGVGTPAVTAEDNGKFLRVVDGQPAWVMIESAEEATFGE